MNALAALARTLLAAALFVGAGAAQAEERNAELHALFDSRWEELMQSYPGWATATGDHRYGDRLEDASKPAIAARDEATRRTLERAQGFDRDRLSAVDRSSLDVFVHGLRDDVRMQPYVGYRSMSLGALGGFQTEFARLLAVSPAETAAQARQVLARMAAWPGRVEQELVLLREGVALSWVPPRAVLERVLAQLDAQIDAAPEASPYYEPFTRLGGEISPAEREALQREARQAISEQVLPAMRALRAFVAGEYLAAAPADGALLHYPRGAEIYQILIQERTTATLSADEVHALGLAELARLRGEIGAVMRELKFDGSVAQFVAWLNRDPANFHSGPEALLAGYRDIAKRIDPELPRLFALLPRAPYGVRAMPAHFDAQRAAFYDGPSLDGTRAGWFNANAKAWATTPRWSMETLVAHEAVPGHHLQIARAVELADLPRFRRDAFFTAYIEGWALYAETLGFELGLYRDAASRFGHLQMQAFRAVRLVVDTGIHAYGWPRERAIATVVEATGLDPAEAAAEVDRYTSWPGQALAYTIGKLKIVELRDLGRARLGERFDLRRFHSVVLDQGPVPLPVLQRAVEDWIAAELAAPR